MVCGKVTDSYVRKRGGLQAHVIIWASADRLIFPAHRGPLLRQNGAQKRRGARPRAPCSSYMDERPFLRRFVASSVLFRCVPAPATWHLFCAED